MVKSILFNLEKFMKPERPLCRGIYKKYELTTVGILQSNDICYFPINMGHVTIDKTAWQH